MSFYNGGDLQSPSSSSEAGTPKSPRFLLPTTSSQTLYKKRKRQPSPTLRNKRDDIVWDRSEAGNADYAASLWSEKYIPKSEKDLAVTPAKVKAVRDWITDSLRSNTQNGKKLLIISGPSGCGKSTTIRTLARTMAIDIHEWMPFGPTTKWSDLVDKQDHESIMSNFIEFLTRSLRHDITFQSTTSLSSRERKKIVLIDDIPDLSNGNSKQRFHSFMRGICRNTDTHVPIILTLTTIEESRGHEPNNGFKRHIYDYAEGGIIPADISRSAYTPITLKKLTKIISSIYKSETLDVPIDFEAIAAISNGDIRSAINNLQFYATPKEQSDSIGHLDMSSIGRETPLDLFHALGKVLYAKRTAKGALQSVPEDILASLCVPEQTFVLWLHQNYLPFMDDMDSCASAVDCLSLANHLASFGEGFIGTDYESLLAVRGMMYSRRLPAKYHSIYKPEFWEYMGSKTDLATTQSFSVLQPSLDQRSIVYANDSEEDDQDIVDTWSDEEADEDMWGDLDDDLLAALPDSQNVESHMEL
ncbi:Rad17 cell cycle checkpoint protein-domain-containing protein [Umbelopsis sp. PMI_123]|nr:Rad17 cell cycle checkpoint protein-domain-containing protein [Umbelopsis sp. PMI_123]